MIEIRQLKVAIGGWEKVYEHAFQSRQWTTITGVSGAGKTTLLKLICGLISHHSGKILVEGKNITGSEIGHRGVSMAFQHSSLFPHLRIIKNLMLAMHDRELNRREKIELLQFYLNGMDLDEGLVNHFPSEVSGGELSRFNLISALLRGKSILLLDEPLASLNKECRIKVVEFLGEIQIKEGLTVLCSSHQTDELRSITNHWISI